MEITCFLSEKIRFFKNEYFVVKNSFFSQTKIVMKKKKKEYFDKVDPLAPYKKDDEEKQKPGKT